ncbi:MAG: hypothetical protein R3C62_01060 [Chloroflexota bacterium]
MDDALYSMIEAIHQTPPRLVFVTAGAGSQALADLLGVGGASETLLEAVVPYSYTAFNDFLGYVPPKYVDAQAANFLAGRAFTRARQLENEGRPVLGLACTATIATNRPKKGEHRAYMALWQLESVTCVNLYLDKGARDRAGEEAVVSQMLLNLLAQACGVVPVPIVWKEGDRVETAVYEFTTAIDQLLNREISFFGVYADGRIRDNGVNPRVVLSGSFNPLHDGHIALAQVAEELIGHPVAFELPAINADKPPLPHAVILDRLAQFAGRYPIYVTSAPTFLEKARLFPGTTFVVGYDTAVRILQPRFYNDTLEGLHAALAELTELGCDFLVAGRIDHHGFFHSCHDLSIPAGYTHLFKGIPANKFRLDISSTDLRKAGKKGSR